MKSFQGILLVGFKRKFVESQFLKAKKRNRESLLSQKTIKNTSGRMLLVVNFHPALSGISRIIESFCLFCMPQRT